MSEKDLNQWRDLAIALPASEIELLNIPKATFLRQAANFANSAEARWAPLRGIPGLQKNNNRFTFKIIAELRSLREAALEADAIWLMIVDPKTPSGLADRGREILRELITIIAYLLDDDIEEPADAQFANMKAEHPNAGGSSDTLSKALYDFAALAERLRPRLVELEDEYLNIDALLTEARSLSTSIGTLPVGPQPPSAASKEAIELRNRIFTLIEKRLDLIRKAANLKYGVRFPEIEKEFSNAYERRRRAALARKKKQEETEQSTKDAERQQLIEELKAQLAQEKLLAEARKQLEAESRK